MAGHNYDRDAAQMRVCFELVPYRVAIHSGQHQIQNDDVGGADVELAKRLKAAARLSHLVMRQYQREAEESPELVIIFHEKHTPRSRH